jgi:hypothetical protein|tara:strand:+ start:172 stop:378 length:207 start_codon:yes stop_codon:yes gene_type:complete
MRNLPDIVFNDSRQSDGLEKTIALINELIEQFDLRIKAQFIEDYTEDEGKYAWRVIAECLPHNDKEIQ